MLHTCHSLLYLSVLVGKTVQSENIHNRQFPRNKCNRHKLFWHKPPQTRCAGNHKKTTQILILDCSPTPSDPRLWRRRARRRTAKPASTGPRESWRRSPRKATRRSCPGRPPRRRWRPQRPTNHPPAAPRSRTGGASRARPRRRPLPLPCPPMPGSAAGPSGGGSGNQRCGCLSAAEWKERR